MPVRHLPVSRSIVSQLSPSSMDRFSNTDPSPIPDNTLEWIKSDKNEFKIEGKFGGFGNRHVNQPWIHTYATQVLSGIGDRSVLENLSMDDGLSCETIDRETGRCLTGIHFPGSSFHSTGVLQPLPYLLRSRNL